MPKIENTIKLSRTKERYVTKCSLERRRARYCRPALPAGARRRHAPWKYRSKCKTICFIIPSTSMILNVCIASLLIATLVLTRPLLFLVVCVFEGPALPRSCSLLATASQGPLVQLAPPAPWALVPWAPAGALPGR